MSDKLFKMIGIIAAILGMIAVYFTMVPDPGDTASVLECRAEADTGTASSVL